MSKEFKKKVKLSGSAKKVYDCLMDSRQHTKFTGKAAFISKKEGGKFSAYNGWIQGSNIELKPGKKIVQAWRGRNWPVGQYSIVTFKLQNLGANKCHLELHQTGIPTGKLNHLKSGWDLNYFGPLKKFLMNDNKTTSTTKQKSRSNASKSRRNVSAHKRKAA